MREENGGADKDKYNCALCVKRDEEEVWDKRWSTKESLKREVRTT